jgi:hypothetical protein
VLIVLKFGNLNLLEPSGSVQACNGFAFIFTFTFYTILSMKYSVVKKMDVKSTILGTQSHIVSVNKDKLVLHLLM